MTFYVKPLANVSFALKPPVRAQVRCRPRINSWDPLVPQSNFEGAAPTSPPPADGPVPGFSSGDPQAFKPPPPAGFVAPSQNNANADLPLRPAAQVPGPYALQVPEGVSVGMAAAAFYQMMAWGTLGLAAACVLLIPEIARTLNFVPLSDVRVLLISAAATLLPISVAHHGLKEAAETQSMGTPFSDALNSAVAVHSILGLTILAQAASLRTPLLTVVVGGLFALALLVSGYTARSVQLQQMMQPPSSWDVVAPLVSSVLLSLRGAVHAARSLVNSPPGLGPLVFAAKSLVLFGLGSAALLAGPELRNPVLGTLAPTPPFAVYTTRMLGAGLIAASIVVGGLKSCADRGLLQARLARVLNVAVAAMAVVVGLCLSTALWVGIPITQQPPAMYVTMMALVAASSAAYTFFPPSPSTTAATVLVEIAPSVKAAGGMSQGMEPQEIQVAAAQVLRESPEVAFRGTMLPVDALAAY